MIELDIDAAVRRAVELAGPPERRLPGQQVPGRRLLAIVGAPGAGKSTLAKLLAEKVDGAVVVGMDAYHLSPPVLADLGLTERRGAPETFDAAGYVALLRRIRGEDGGTVWAPEYRREIENAVAGVVAVRPDSSLVITEGNYLALAEPPWSEVRELADEIWYVDAPEALRQERLAARHQRFGRTEEQAWRRTLGIDEENARLVRASRHRTDLVVRIEPDPVTPDLV